MILVQRFPAGQGPSAGARAGTWRPRRPTCRRIRLHDGRLTAASLALEARVEMKVVSHQLGHSSTKITSDLYTQVRPAVSLDAAERVAEIIRLQEPHHSEVLRVLDQIRDRIGC